jgi:predicted transcriptional regulator
MNRNFKPTDAELEILSVLWEKKEASVREVHTSLSSYKKVGYTTVLKLMQIMHGKGLVNRREEYRKHFYFALLDKNKYRRDVLLKLKNTLFDGSKESLLSEVNNLTS